MDDEEGRLGLIMEYVEGESLDKSANWLPEQIFQILVIIAKTLDFLHGKGIVHRDIKPENIKLHPERGPIILDFGISKDVNVELTNSTVSMGTPVYMSPEQMDAKSVTGAADQYSLAMMTYKLLSGVFPWKEGASPSHIIALKMTGKLQPLSHNMKEIPIGVSDALSRAL